MAEALSPVATHPGTPRLATLLPGDSVLKLLSAAAGQQRGVMGVNYTITYLAFHKYCYFNFFKQLVQDLIIVEYKNKLPINMYIYFFPK